MGSTPNDVLADGIARRFYAEGAVNLCFGFNVDSANSDCAFKELIFESHTLHLKVHIISNFVPDYEE